ncbi:uncharacterized protein N7511_005792 [Penicillium nucicola]|uniref:uncharacterized protein n=1 Tax=Penicillium nucicola TaxID=1850975 RepID=UPI0025455F9A|nr:uncharacterized protein N7511_005792 [Penicillium nucicola]KAJ5762410.1 hypothetical protein N7511_005792 [Penicillium nucicola]
MSTADINLVSEFLSDNQQDLSPVDCIVICASAVLHSAEVLFATLQQRPSLTKALVLCGGIGHSTTLLYDAVKAHPIFSRIANEIQDLPEAKVLERILDEFYDRSLVTKEGCRILLEPDSTNCGQNASFSRKVLGDAGFQAPRTCMVIQDPTMMLRTRASFVKMYEDAPSPVSIISCPVFVPRMQLSPEGTRELCPISTTSELWSQGRFLELIMGEIPRLRDDKDGYGPRGRGFISHVDIPDAVEAAWSRLEVMTTTLQTLTPRTFSTTPPTPFKSTPATKETPFRMSTTKPTNTAPPSFDDVYYSPYQPKRQWPPDMSKLSPKHQFRLERKYRRRAALKYARPQFMKAVTLGQWVVIGFVIIYAVLFMEWQTENTPFHGIREAFFDGLKSVFSAPPAPEPRRERKE